MEKKTMMDYIEETPSVLQYNINHYHELLQPLLDYIADKHIKTLVLIASGSSYNACYTARTFIQKCTNIHVRILTPYTYTYYEDKVGPNELAIVISQSGLSTNAIQALCKLKANGYDAICLTGNRNSDVKDYADLVLDYGVGEELVGYVTKGVTTLALYLCVFAIVYTKKYEYLEDIQKIPNLNQQCIEKSQKFIKKHYKRFSSMHQCYVCGAGATFGTALEGALKIGETIHIPSYCYEIEEYIHGPNLQLTPSYTVIFFDNNDEATSRVKQIYLASRKVTDNCFFVSQSAIDEHTFSLEEKIIPELASLVYLPFVQILAYTISSDLNTTKQHPLLKEFKKIASAKTKHFVNYDDDE